MQSSVGREIKMLSNLIMRKLDACMMELGLDSGTAVNSCVLGYLYINSDRVICQKDIEKEFRLARSTVAGLVKLMEKKGLIERDDVESDARLKSLRLTKKGEQVHFVAIAGMEKLEEKLRSGISENEINSFIKTAQKMRDNLNKCEKGEIYD